MEKRRTGKKLANDINIPELLKKEVVLIMRAGWTKGSMW